MNHRPNFRSLALLTLPLFSVGGCFLLGLDFERESTLAAGTAAGTVTLQGAPVEGARISIRHGSDVRLSSTAGKFAFPNLPLAGTTFDAYIDGDGDGILDAVGHTSTYVASLEHPDGVPFNDDTKTTGNFLGGLVLEETSDIEGRFLVELDSGVTVSPSTAGYHARVYVTTRRPSQSQPGENAWTAVRASAAPDAAGRYRIRGAPRGDRILFGVLYEQGAVPGTLGAVLTASTAAVESDSDFTELVVNDPEGVVDNQMAEVRFHVTSVPIANTYLITTPAGRDLPRCNATAPDPGPITDGAAAGVASTQRPTGDVMTFTVVPGFYDMRLCTRGFGSVLLGVGVPASAEGTENPFYEEIVVGSEINRGCTTAGATVRDCDNDGLAQLPVYGPSETSSYAEENCNMECLCRYLRNDPGDGHSGHHVMLN